MRDTPYAKELARADVGGQRIERLYVKESGAEEIRFSWWKDGRMQARPLDLPEHELLALFREAVQQRVFSDHFIAVLRSSLDEDKQSLPPNDFEQDELFEMANLDEDDTHIPGTIFVSTAIGSHGPRIKWYPGSPGRALPCLILSIGPDPVVRDNFLPERQTRPVMAPLKVWISQNHEALLSFWKEGESWNHRKVAAFLGDLKPYDGDAPRDP